MNIRPKNAILFAQTGVKFSQNNLRGANWRQQVFNNYRQHLLDQLAKYGEADDYGSWLNEMQSRHSKLYNLAGGENGNWEDTAYKNDLVGQYQQDYRGGLGNDNQYKRYGSVQLSNDDKYDFNQTGIKTNQSTRYNIVNPPTRTSGDYSREGYNYKVDNLYSAITDDRRLLGRKGDWDENSQEFKSWQKDLNSKGWETYLDTNDNYYKLRRLPQQVTSQQTPQEQGGSGINPNEKIDKNSDFWKKLSAGFNKIAPDLLAAVRYAGNMHNNERVYNEMKQAIIPNLQGTYTTHRQIVGDEATKQAYYRRAAQGESRAAKPFTADADRQMAYMMEAKRVGDELRAQGDLADNQEIRRTSDESNQHQWANAQRANEVANSDITELNKAKAAQHQLKAQKYSADWTNTDEYLLGWQNKFQQKQAKQQAIQDQVDLLTMQDAIYDDPAYKKAYENLQAVVKKHTDSSGTIDSSAPEVIEAQRALRKAKNNYLINYYSTKMAKSGMKITKKDTSDRFLYKTSRDIVEHFRKMSKMTDDSRIKTMPKPIKLSSHPRKMQLGGVAPFTVYRPLGAAGGETTTQTSTGTDSKSSKDDPAKNKLDMIKEMFKAVQNTGLPIDVNVIYKDLNNLMQKAKLFGEELSTDDIASIYLQSMQKINNLKYSKENYDKAMAVATSNEALNEYAVDASGNYVVQDKEGNLSIAKSLSEIAEKGLNPITNQQLLNLRAYSPNMAFQRGDALVSNIINNGMGINKIGAQIKALAGSLGSTEGKLEGISQVESGKVRRGLEMLAEAPSGHYQITNYTKDQQSQVQAALKYIENMLSPSQKAILEAHGGTKQNIALFLTSQQDYTNEQTISPLTGKAAGSKNGSSSGENDMLPSVAFFNGMGEKDQFIIQDKTSDGLKVNVISTPITSKGYNTGSITFDKLESSDFGGQLLINQATMGDSLISSIGRSNIIIDGRIYQTELPIDKVAKAQGIIKPDLKFLKKIEVADQKLRQMGIDKNDPANIPTINKVYQENDLPILYTISDNKPVLTSDYARFAIVNGVGTEDAFGENPEFNDGIKKITGTKEREQFEAMMKQQSGNSKYKLNNGYGVGPLSWGETELYQGTIFIPMATSNISALAGTGYKAKGDEYNEIEARQQAADAAREMGFKPAGDSSNLK